MRVYKSYQISVEAGRLEAEQVSFGSVLLQAMHVSLQQPGVPKQAKTAFGKSNGKGLPVGSRHSLVRSWK